MKFIAIGVFVLLVIASVECKAQKFEFGVVGGRGIASGLTSKLSNATADTGIATGAALGVALTDNMYSHVSGELGYLFRKGNFRLSSGGEETTLSGQSHILHYDLLIHPLSNKFKLRPFVAVGSGVRFFQATGTPLRVQPLRQFVRLAKDTDLQLLISWGAGIKWDFLSHASLRMEVHDYMTQPPKSVLVPATGASIDGWMHDIVPLFGLSYTF